MNKIDDIDTELQRIQQQMKQHLQSHWRLFLAEGIFFMVLGVFAILIPQLFTVAAVVFLGWLLLLGGAVQVGRSFMFINMPGFGWWVFIGVLQVVLGYLFIVKPVAGALTLTMLLTMFFALEGVAKISLSFMMRPLANWKFILFSGITSLAFAVIVWLSWSESAHWLLGLFLGINMVVLGWSLLKISLHHKVV
ncbi:MAG: HdeD family acid-resistance protein [Methylobacter sp.]